MNKSYSDLVPRTGFADDLGITLYHYRSHRGAEIDVIAETDDGRVAGIAKIRKAHEHPGSTLTPTRRNKAFTG